jgi:hypothetical protein
MPDALLSLLAFLTAAVVAAPGAATRLYPLLMLAGCVCGLLVLQILPGFPPVSAADRFLYLLPVLMLADLAETVLPTRMHRLLRSTALLTPVPLILHQSVWLTQPAAATIQGITPTGWLLLAGLTPLPLTGAVLLQRLTTGFSRPAVAAGLPLNLTCCLLCSAVVIMLGGYLKGGLLALPLAGSMLPFALRNVFAGPRPDRPLPLTYCWGSLCCLLLIGLFFGRLTPLQCSCFAAIPLVTALPLPPGSAEHCGRRQTVIRTVLTALLCSLLLYQAWSVFAVRMLPLLAHRQQLAEQPFRCCPADACSATLGQTASAGPPCVHKPPVPPHTPAG